MCHCVISECYQNPLTGSYPSCRWGRGGGGGPRSMYNILYGIGNRSKGPEILPAANPRQFILNRHHWCSQFLQTQENGPVFTISERTYFPKRGYSTLSEDPVSEPAGCWLPRTLPERQRLAGGVLTSAGVQARKLSGQTLLRELILNQRSTSIFKPQLIFMQIICIYAKYALFLSASNSVNL